MTRSGEIVLIMSVSLSSSETISLWRVKCKSGEAEFWQNVNREC